MLITNIPSSDRISGLPLYEDFLKLASEYISSHPVLPDGYVYAFVATDIANFRYINQLYGYECSDKLLRKLSDMISQVNPKCVIASRPYSDHFIGLHIARKDRQYTFRTDQSIYSTGIKNYNDYFSQTNKDDYPLVSLHLHNGIYFVNDISESVVSCIDKANMARRCSKGVYGTPCIVYDNRMLSTKEDEARALVVFEEALRNNRIQVYLQPKVRSSDQRVIGAEALSRLSDESGRIVNPGDFIPALENSGRIVELDIFVLSFVCKLLHKWISSGIEPIPISLNLSKVNFFDHNLANKIIDIANEFSVPPHLIELEVTESAFFKDSDLISRTLRKLRSFGFLVSIDDFGVGYSTLNTLGVLPADIVKFDRSFVRNSIDSAAGLTIMMGLFSLLKEVNYSIVCEGIETSCEEKIIVQCGCDKLQGYLYDRPIPCSTFEEKYMKPERVPSEARCV